MAITKENKPYGKTHILTPMFVYEIPPHVLYRRGGSQLPKHRSPLFRSSHCRGAASKFHDEEKEYYFEVEEEIITKEVWEVHYLLYCEEYGTLSTPPPPPPTPSTPPQIVLSFGGVDLLKYLALQSSAAASQSTDRGA